MVMCDLDLVMLCHATDDRVEQSMMKRWVGALYLPVVTWHAACAYCEKHGFLNSVQRWERVLTFFFETLMPKPPFSSTDAPGCLGCCAV